MAEKTLHVVYISRQAVTAVKKSNLILVNDEIIFFDGRNISIWKDNEAGGGTAVLSLECYCLNIIT